MKNNYLYCLECKQKLSETAVVCPNCMSEYSQIVLKYKRNVKVNNIDKLYDYFLPFNLFKKNDFKNCSFKKYAQNLWMKNEGENASKSIKEKELIVGLKVAKYFRSKPYCISSGTGISSSIQLAKKIHIPIKLYSPKTNKKINKNQSLIGDDYEDTFKIMLSKKNKNSFNITPGINPYSQEGAKVISWNLIQTRKNIDCIVIPCGNGSSLWGIYKGYNEAKKNGLINKIPRLYGIELKNGPIGRSLLSMKIEKNKEVHNSKAHGIDTKESFCLKKVITALKKTKGEMIIISECEIENSYEELHKKGFKSNHTAAASLAGAKKLHRKYFQDMIVCILTADE